MANSGGAQRPGSRRPGARRRIHPGVLLGCLFATVLLIAPTATVEAGSQTTSFVHSVGFSFDYPTKWELQRVQEGLMLIPHDAGTDAGGRPLELIVIGFVNTAGITDPFDPAFSVAFEQRYQAMIPGIQRTGELDWVASGMGTGVVAPFDDANGNRHGLYCAVHGELGIFLAHVTQGKTARSKAGRVQQILASFGWSDSVIDPDLVKTWTAVDGSEKPQEDPAGHWSFATDGRLRYAESSDFERAGFYSSFDGVLNIVWDHGVEENYLYAVDHHSAELKLHRSDSEAWRSHCPRPIVPSQKRSFSRVLSSRPWRIAPPRETRRGLAASHQMSAARIHR